MKNSLRYILLLAIVILTGAYFEIEAQNQPDYLNRGLEAKNAGEYETALETWFEARQELDEPNLQLSVEYLRLVTEKKMRDYYKMAFSMYQWGLSAKEVEPNQAALADEINRLTPITESEKVDYWEELLDNKDPHLYTELIYFWEELNVLPTNNYNSRLLEHWERIAFAVENYGDENREPYGTDIRGDYYVKFGPPNKAGKLDLLITRNDVISVFSNLSAYNITDSQRDLRSSTFASDFNVRFDDREITDRIFEYQPTGKAHIWSYDTISNEGDFNQKLIFRETPAGDFERVNVIDDLIPSTAFLNKSFEFEDRQRSTGNLMQLIYYQRLSSFDKDFASIYSSMESDLYSTLPPEIFTSSGFNFKWLNKARAERNIAQAPRVISTDLRAASEIPLDVYQYRMLNDDDEPIFVTYVENQPLNAFYLDVVNNDQDLRNERDSFLDDIEKWRVDRLSSTEFSDELISAQKLNNYQLSNTLHLKSEDQQLIGRSYVHPTLVIDEDDHSIPSIAAFEIPYIKANTQQIFFSELKNNDENSNPARESTLPKNLRGFGQKSIPQPDHWDMSKNNLLVSDLIIGFQKHEELEEIDLFPFIVSNDRKIPSDEPLIIHFEAYQLASDEQGMSQFEVDYNFTKTGSFLGLFDSTIEGISNTIVYDHDANRFAESLELQTTGMEPGEYKLSFTVTDKINGQSVKREVSFEVIEREEFYVSDL